MGVSKEKLRYVGIDSLRGWLILSVMLGHLVLGSVHDNFIRYSIYAFHMPVFIGLTGYLINADSLRRASMFDTLKRYWWRVLFPFSFAFALFSGVLLFHAFDEARVTSSLLLSYIHTPYYHLWFIPTLVLWVFAFSAILKLRIPLILVLGFSLLASLVWGSIPKAEQWAFVAPFLSKKVIYFFGFFLFGAWLRTSGSKKIRSIMADFKVLPIALVIGCASLYLINIGSDKSLLRALVWIVLNITLITLLIDAATSDANTKKSLVSNIGRNSLPIYLWHVVPLFLLKGFDIHQTQVTAYYLAGSISMALIVFAILSLENKNKWLNRVLFGVV